MGDFSAGLLLVSSITIDRLSYEFFRNLARLSVFFELLFFESFATLIIGYN